MCSLCFNASIANIVKFYCCEYHTIHIRAEQFQVLQTFTQRFETDMSG